MPPGLNKGLIAQILKMTLGFLDILRAPKLMYVRY